MGKFSKIFHHIESKDLRNKYEQKKVAKIQEEKKKEDTKKYIASAMEQIKYNWREGMTTSAVSVSKEIEAAPGDWTVTPVDAIDVNSYTGTTGVLAANDDLGANVGTQIRASGSGEGHGGHFLLFKDGSITGHTGLTGLTWFTGFTWFSEFTGFTGCSFKLFPSNSDDTDDE